TVLSGGTTSRTPVPASRFAFKNDSQFEPIATRDASLARGGGVLPVGVAQGVRVLAVDNDPLAQQSLSEYLAENDITVIALETGRDVEAVILREASDLLILDYKLPGENGLRVAQKVRERWQLPIIMLTGRRDEADRVMALELAVDDYLTKPFSPRELLARIRAL